MRTSRVVMLIMGCFVALVGVALLIAGAFLSWAFFVQRDGGELTLPTERYETASSALISDDIDIFDSADRPNMMGFDDLGHVTLQVTAADPNTRVFIGIGPTAEVTRYLDGVAHTKIDEVSFNPFRVDYDDVPGTRAAALPGRQDLWSAAMAGPGTQKLSWDLQDGSWTAVVMNADASPGVAVDLQPGVHFDFLGPLAVTVLVIAAVLLIIGIPLIVVGAVGLARPDRVPQGQPGSGSPLSPMATPAPGQLPRYPAALTGERDEPLSRWLWLVKWILAIPHYIVLIFLGIAFFFTTIAAGFAVLFTGRYPRRLFDFNVGVLRWAWRVQFYSYSALGTDRYPPFTLNRADYPADFTVEYPEKLSRGLVLVKWWLLAIPHYLVLALLAGGWYAGYRVAAHNDELGFAGQPYFFSSVLGLLILVAGVGLLFTSRYPQGLFDLVIGINRWAFRVAAYTALMRDEYPPFRLDQGPREQSAEPLAPPVPYPSIPGENLTAEPTPEVGADRNETQPPKPRDRNDP